MFAISRFECTTTNTKLHLVVGISGGRIHLVCKNLFAKSVCKMQKWKNGLQNWSYQIHSRIILDTYVCILIKYTHVLYLVFMYLVVLLTYLSVRIKKVTLDSFHPTGIIIFKLTDSTKNKKDYQYRPKVL